MNTDQTVKKSVSLYTNQNEFIQRIADERFRGKFSRALQYVIDRYAPLHDLLEQERIEKEAAINQLLKDHPRR